MARRSSIVLVIGLGISLAALIETNKHFNGKIAELGVQSANFNKLAAAANERASRAQVETAELQVKAEELEEKNLEQGSRDLLLYGKRGEEFTNAIRPLKGQKIELRRCLFSDNEARDTAERLTVLFKVAGWVVSPGSPDWGEGNCMFVHPNEPAPTGIWVGMPNAHPTPQTEERAKELVRILNQVPLVATSHFVQIDTARANESRESISERYGDSDSIVLTVVGHPSKTATLTSAGVHH